MSPEVLRLKLALWLPLRVPASTLIFIFADFFLPCQIQNSLKVHVCMYVYIILFYLFLSFHQEVYSDYTYSVYWLEAENQVF